MARRGRPPYRDILTPREWEVLALLREELSNEEIAERLGITLAGAKYHVSEILSKLGVESREEAARWEPEARRPWWAVAAAPFGATWRKVTSGPVAATAAAGALLIAAAGLALLIWGLSRTSGSNGTSALAPTGTATGPLGQDSCRSPGRAGGATPENLLSCDQLTQPLYWLGRMLKVPGLPDVELNGSYTTNDERPISGLTNLVLQYGPGNVPKIALTEWNRVSWQDFAARYTGYDPATVPTQGPVNWWQHPCVEEDIYHADNGAEVHLFRAHLDSIIRIFPMSPAEVAACRSRPVGIIGAHVYFERTVIQLEVGTAPGNEYDAEETVRYLASSLKPYEAP